MTQGREVELLWNDSTTEEITYTCCGTAARKDRNGTIYSDGTPSIALTYNEQGNP